jgi:hypothetical protein
MAFQRRKQFTELQEDLYGFLTNSELVIGTRYPSRNICSPSDVRAVLEIIDNVPFSVNPEVKVKNMQQLPKLQGSICSFCGLANDFDAWIIGDGEKPDVEGLSDDLLPKLPYKFNFRLEPRCANLTINEIKKLDPPPNASIMETNSHRNVYIPRFDRNTGNYMRDYLMIVKMSSPHVEGNIRGDKCLIIAGCHGIGTEAGPIALRSNDILKQIWDKVGDDDFQAIFAVHAEEQIPKRVSLLQVESLA